MKRSVVLLAVMLQFLSGCAGQDATAGHDKPANPQQQALEQAEQAGLLEDGKEEAEPLTAHDAAGLLGEALAPEEYLIELTDIQLEIGQEEDGAHSFFVFDIKDMSGGAVGQAAVDKLTGEKYRYLGEGRLDDFDTLSLEMPEAEQEVCDWAGGYTSPVGVTLEILQGDQSSFEYLFSDGTTGHARITGNTAKSDGGEINFLYSEDIITVAGGGLTGNYTENVI